MAKVYIRGLPVTPYNTLTLAACANDFITKATASAPAGGGLSTVSDIEVEIYNNVMFFIIKDLS